MGVHVRESIEIAAPVERVFAWFDDLDNAEELVPSLVAITKVEPLENGGRHVYYRVETKTDVVDASSEHLEYAPPHRTVSRGLQSGVSTTSTREFEPVDGGTRVTASVEWDVPIRYVARLVTAPLRGPLRRSLRTGLEAAKDALER